MIALYLNIFLSLMHSQSFNTPANKNFTIIYVGDPMCSWCYGFTNEWHTLIGNFPDAEVKYIMGGLRPNGSERMADLKDFLREHWEEIHHRTAMPFKYDVLERDMVYNTEPACRAVVTFRHFNAAKTGAFFKSIQQAFYDDNHNPYLASNYAALAEKLGVNKEDYLAYYNSHAAVQETMADFQMAGNLGVSGFPTVLAEVQGKIYVVSRGYQTAQVMYATTQKLLAR